MNDDLIYLDNHSTTACDPAVVAAMLPLFTENFGNPHSTSHRAGFDAEAAMTAAIESMAQRLGCGAAELVMTSGATESNNLGLLGVCGHPANQKRHIVSVVTEHPAVLDPLTQLEREGFEVTRLPVTKTGFVEPSHVAESLRDDTAIVSVMLANNEIGVIQPLDEIIRLAHTKNIPVHTDATQAIGRVDVDLRSLDVDLLSASAHKFYGPKGIGFLFVRRKGRRAKIKPLMEGGGQQRRLRPGTMNPAGIVGMATALQLCIERAAEDRPRIRALRDRMIAALRKGIAGLELNGPPLDSGQRLDGNLNLFFPNVEGESLMMACPTIAVSSGSACSSVDPRPSHVLTGIGRDEASSRSSLRIGIGRFNTEAEVDAAAQQLVDAYCHLRSLSA